ncbi:hypothetical protein [Pseudodesulfovibrio tunisiensis]|uniref:hypothetical protein n=1 Tax=Pseudodesulfovibrio tunisiensis TaxID=463192 RepID=UPI001FB27B4A|nr:hypothetical protein [Pseudodesulfovibrio tunisiensis]
MGTVVALDEYKARVTRARPAPADRPELVGSEIWGRDYTELESVVFGLLKAREVVAYHVCGNDEEYDHLSLEALEAAYRIADFGPDRLRDSIAPLKEWILDVMTPENKRDLSWAIVLLDLIEKSPLRPRRHS